MDKLPDLSKSFGKQLDSLKDTIGPEGNETVEKAYKQLREIATSKGSAKETLAKAQKVVDETLAKLREVAQNKSGDLQAKGAEALKALPGMDRVRGEPVVLSVRADVLALSSPNWASSASCCNSAAQKPRSCCARPSTMSARC